MTHIVSLLNSDDLEVRRFNKSNVLIKFLIHIRKGKGFTMFSYSRVLVERNHILLQSCKKQIIPASKHFLLGSLQLQGEKEFCLICLL